MRVLAAAVLVCWTVSCLAQDRVVYSTGAPTPALDATTVNPQNPTLLRFGFISGKQTQGGNYPERWTAGAFHLANADTVNAFEVAYYAGSPTPTDYRWRIYRADGPGGAPGTVIASGNGTLSSLYPRRHIFANGFVADSYVRVPITAVTLSAGDYWFTFYSLVGEIVWYAGAPGGPKLPYNYRRTTSGSSWTAESISPDDTRMPNFGPGGLYSTVYPAAGPHPNDLYQPYFTLLNVGGGGTTLTGTIALSGWSLGASKALSDGKPQVYELRLLDPATGKICNVFTFPVNANGGFSVGPVQPGVYDMVLKPVSYIVGRFGIYGAADAVVSEQSQAHGFGVPFLGVRMDGVSVAGPSQALGTFVLIAGDSDLSGSVDISDLNRALVTFGLSATTAPVSEDLRYFDDFDASRTTDLYDLNTVLTNFGSSGPGS